MTHATTRRALLAIAVAGSLAACSGGSGDGGDAGGATGDGGGDVTLNFTWWGNDDRAQRYEEAIALFEEENPDITVNGTFADWEAYWTARNTEAAGRALPDVMQTDLSYLREYSENNHLLDLSAHEGAELDVSGYEESLLSSGRIEDQLVGVPTSTNTLALFINPQLVEEAGVEPPQEGYTWEDYNAWVRQVTEAGIETESGQQAYGGGDYTATFWFFIQWLVQQGQQPFADDGTFNFTQEDIVEFLELASGLREEGQVVPPDRAVQLQPLDAFAAGESATSFSWDNFLAGYAADSGVEDIEMMPMPSGPSGGPDMFWKPSMLLSAGANTEHPEAAATFISFMVNNPEVGRIFGTSKGVPAVEAQREAMELEEGSIDARVVAYEEQVADLVTADTPAPIKGFGSIEAEWLRLSEDLQYGNITPQEFAEQWWTEAEMATQ